MIVLDLDDTLYLERQYAASGFRAASRHLVATRGVPGLDTVAQALFSDGVRGDIYDRALRTLGIEDPDVVQELVGVHRSHRPSIGLAPDAGAFLVRARSYGLTLALVSDGYLQVQRLKVEALGLRGAVEPVVLTDRWGREGWKPSPRGFEEVMSRHGGPPSEYVYIGDNPAKDFQGPHGLGWATIRIRRPGGEHSAAEASGDMAPAQREIASFDELPLDSLAGP